MAAPVVPCGCCVAGLAPARTAAVWLSVWAAGITGRPFTPAQTAVCSPSPSTLTHSALAAPSFIFLSFTSSAYPPLAYITLPSATLLSFTCLCVWLCFWISLASLYFFFFLFFCVCPHQPFLLASRLTQKLKHKQQQLGAVIVLVWNSIAFSVKDEVVNNKLPITTKSPE